MQRPRKHKNDWVNVPLKYHMGVVPCFACGKQKEPGEQVFRKRAGTEKNRLFCSYDCLTGIARPMMKRITLYNKWRSKQPKTDSGKFNFHWRRLRYAALKQNGGHCELCGRRAGQDVVLHVDHIKPRSNFPELSLEISNLQVLCQDCNLGKSNSDEIDWRSEKDETQKKDEK